MHVWREVKSPSLVLMTGVISYPIPPYSNPPIEPQFYQPNRFLITALTFGMTTLVTTSIDHNYVIGQEIRFIIPPNYGSRKLNDIRGYVLTIPNTNQVTVDVNSIGTDPFIPSPTGAKTQAQILAIGDINGGAINNSGRISTSTIIPGSFINISPV